MDEQALRGTLGAGPDCLPVEILSANLALNAADSPRVAAERHLLQCLHCRTQLDLLREFESGEVRPEEEADVEWIAGRLRPARQIPPSRAWWRFQWITPRWLTGLAAVAAIALAAVAIVPQWQLRREAARPLPEFANETLRARKIEIVEMPGAFAWKPVPGAAGYELTVRTIDDTAIFHNTFTATTLAFPAEVAAVEQTGKLLEWEVIAKNSKGDTIAESGVQKLRRTQ